MLRRFYNDHTLDLTVFVCGALVMIFEIIGSRLLSPFIGTSTYVWTSLIGVILGALSLGYWLGGRLADRHPDAKILSAVILAAGGMISVTVLVKDIFLSALAGAAVSLEIKAVIAALVLFAPASVCLGVITPFAIRLKTTSLDTTGRTVGRLYAFSTIGSIIGTFSAGFFFIPFVGSSRTLYLIAATLLILAALVAPLAWTARNLAAGIVLILGIAATEGNAYLLRQASEVYDIDTEYSRVQVFRTIDPRTGRPIRAMATDPYFVQSAAFFDSEELVLEYSRFYHLIGHYNPGFERTLMIGGAGYSFPKDYLRLYPSARLDVVEIDPQMTEIARKFFRLQDDARMRIIHEDARMFLRRSEGGQYDAILMDAFGSLFSVPHHLTTIEAVREMYRVLKPDGVVIFNLGSAITGEASGFLQAEFATYQQVFPQVSLYKVRLDHTDDQLQNLIIVASRSPRPAPAASGDPQIARLLDHLYTSELKLTRPILTDELAPVEYYNSIAQNFYIANR